ncbi:MAG TPA: hypothetical protein VKH40_11930, partial [Alloacidobacterium sp.]|nr:hypothetical protein [Alloacidobacterium sp.]
CDGKLLFESLLFLEKRLERSPDLNRIGDEKSASRQGSLLNRRAFLVSILGEGGRLGLKCLLLSYFRVGDDTEPGP